MRKVTLLMIASFLAVQLLALAVGSQFVAQEVSVVDNPADPANAGYFFAYVLFSAVMLLLELKFYKGNLLFVALEFILLFFSLQILFSLALDGMIAAGIALAITLGRFAYPRARAVLLLVSSSVVGALLGSSLDILPAVIFSALLAGYDVVAVFWTKHMVTLAQGLSERGAAFSIQITAEKKVEARARGTKAPLKLPKGDAAYRKGIATKVSAPTTGRERDSYETIELGTGDLVIPAMLLVSALKITPLHAIAAFGGSVLGMAALFWVLERERGYWPALPPLVFGALLGLTVAQALLMLKVL